MGQNQSHPGPAARHDEIDGKSSSSSRPSYKPSGSSLFEFALLWLGGKIHPAAVSLPSCWDEFLDWAEDATNITAVLRINNLCNVETTSNSIADDRIRETDTSPTFTPLALNGDCEILENLPSMTWMERASLYSESVVVAVDTSDMNISFLLTPVQFSMYYALVCRLADLLALSRAHRETPHVDSLPLDPQPLGECLICLSDSENAILPCGHKLCEACEKRWVRKRLVCPFCRHRFSSARQVQSDGYHMAEWSEPALESDITTLDTQILEFWATIRSSQPGSTQRQALMETYVAAPRMMRVSSERDGFLVVDQDAPQRTDTPNL